MSNEIKFIDRQIHHEKEKTLTILNIKKVNVQTKHFFHCTIQFNLFVHLSSNSKKLNNCSLESNEIKFIDRQIHHEKEKTLTIINTKKVNV